MGFQRLQLESGSRALLVAVFEQIRLLLVHRGAFGHQPEQHRQRIMQIAAVALNFGGERCQLQFTQLFERIALEVDLGIHWCVTQLWACLDVEQEQHPVHVAQTFPRQLAGIQFVLAAEDAFFLFLRLGNQLPRGLVADQFDAFAQGVFQVFRNTVGMLVGVFIQCIQQALAVGIQQGFAMQQHTHGFQGLGFTAGE